VLVVDLDTLGSVDLLHLVDQVLLGGTDATDVQDFLGVERALGQLRAGFDCGPAAHPELGVTRDRVDRLAIARVQHQSTTFGVFDQGDNTLGVGEHRFPLRGPRFE